jgi:hypothetical protein
MIKDKDSHLQMNETLKSQGVLHSEHPKKMSEPMKSFQIIHLEDPNQKA